MGSHFPILERNIGVKHRSERGHMGHIRIHSYIHLTILERKIGLEYLLYIKGTNVFRNHF